MNWFKKNTSKKAFKLFSIVMLLFYTFSTVIPPKLVVADTQYDVDTNENGEIRNEKTGKDYERASIDKKVSWGNKPGEYFIDLKIEGKDATKIETTDIVLVYDNSSSMGTHDRVTTAKNATTNFVNGLLNTNNTFQIALVTFGSAVFDGRERTWANYPGYTDDYSFKTLTKNPGSITNQLPSDVPSSRGGNTNTWHGGTFTQQALEEAGSILSNSTADNKAIITITDGVPTFSYNSDRTVVGNGSNYGENGENTVQGTNQLKSLYDLYTIGVEISDGSGATKAEAEQLLRDISSTTDHAYFASNVNQLEDYLHEIANRFNQSIVNGSVEDPMGDMFVLQGADHFTPATDDQLTNGNYYLSASNSALLQGVTVTAEGQKIKLNGLNLGEDDVVTLRYKVQIDTERENFQPGELYLTNGETTLTPRGSYPNEKNLFPEPAASAVGITLSGEKLWDDHNLESNRPDQITLKLMRDRNGTPKEVASTSVIPDENGSWNYQFENHPKYDRNGNMIEYYVEEEPIEGYEAITDPNNPFTITNKLIPNPAISLVKEANRDDLTTGEQIEYTFTVTNIGNLPLGNIVLTDELDGLGPIEFLTINGEEINDPSSIVLQPKDVLIAKAPYTITQEDLDNGQVINQATVQGTSTTNDTTVEDQDDVKVTQESIPDILLEKTSDVAVVTEVGQVVNYTFKVTNTGNVTLTDVLVNDPMLDGNIELEKSTLAPGESTVGTAAYTVTQADLDKTEIINTATTEGTPPHYDPSNPDSVEKPTDEDTNEIPVEQTPGISLVKEADRDQLVVGEQIRYTFTTTNTGNVTLTNVTLSDELEGLSEIYYLSINGESIVNQTGISLAPGDVLVAEATYTVTQEDVDRGEVINFAHVVGLDPKGDEVKDEDSVEIKAVGNPGIKINKTSDVEEVTEVGQVITYSFDVTNTGNVTLTDVQLDDPMLGGEIELEKTTLAPNESTKGTATYNVTEADLASGKIKNVATATGTPPNPNDPKPVDSDEVDVLVGSIQLEKSSTQEVFTEVGQTVTYKFVITNNGEVTLNNIQLNDPKLGGKIELVNTVLEPGESTDVDVEYIVSAEDYAAGEIINTADVTAETPKGTEVKDTDNDMIQKASIELQKTSDVELVTVAGQQITYTFEVTNTGNVTLTEVQVNDPMLGGEITLESTTLEPGQSTTGTAIYYATQKDLDQEEIVNIATVEGTPPEYNPNDPDRSAKPTDTDDNVIPVEQTPSISLEKETDREGLIAGEQIEYTFTVVNTGNVTLTNVYITDILDGISDVEYVTINDESIVLEKNFMISNIFANQDYIKNYMNQQANVADDSYKSLKDIAYLTSSSIILKPGDVLRAKATYTITQADVDNGQVFNEATVMGLSPKNEEVTDKDQEIVEQESAPAIELDKASDVEKVSEAGQQITYTFNVTNTGNVTLTNVQVNDPMLGGEISLESTTLAPGESTLGKATYVVTQEDINNGEIMNKASTEGTPPHYDPNDPDSPEKPTDEDENLVAVEHSPEISLVKEADRTDLKADEQIRYTFTVTNTGNVTLSNVAITDLLQDISDIQYISINGNQVEDPSAITLNPGDLLIAEATYTITQHDIDVGKVINEASVTGKDPNGENVTAKDNVTVSEDQLPSISLEKTSDIDKATTVGQIVTYTFKVTNTGNVTLQDIILNDPMLGGKIDLDKTTLLPGESTTLTKSYSVKQSDLDNGKIENVADVTGFTLNEDSVSDEDNDIIPTDEEKIVSPIAEKLVQTSNNFLGLAGLGLLLLTAGSAMIMVTRRKATMNE
ncbi:DUF7507 domain-containing protein [Bacillus weihaiensis]|uniref:DUF7507 domain-containing protein n=1 Tax=Bacillus weihaiensis TaxID=1547283 RepID=UPI0023578F50|nr:Cna B-type domain-containing protein [Bacillus weihaiensis]